MIDYEKIFNEKIEPKILDKDQKYNYNQIESPKHRSMIMFLSHLMRRIDVPTVFIKDDCQWVKTLLDVFLIDKSNIKFTVNDLFDYLEELNK